MTDVGEGWGWMRYLGVKEEKASAVVLSEDWLETFSALLCKAPPKADTQEHLAQAVEGASLALFVDAHNTGYYINSYTTKLNPTMDNVLRRLLDGVRRLLAEWASKEGDDEEKEAPRITAFKKRMQALCRFETKFRSSQWKGGSEIAFTILFGHLSFVTHRCWNVFTRKAIFCASEAWRLAYGQLATDSQVASECRSVYKLPENVTNLLDGWSQEERDGRRVFTAPDGREVDAARYLQAVAKHKTSDPDAKQRATLEAFANLLHEGTKDKVRPLEGSTPAAEDTKSSEDPGAAAGKPPKATYCSTSQHDDWLHRGDHPLLRHMNFYLYSMWVYRAEKRIKAKKGKERKASGVRLVEIDFDPSYTVASSWTQRIASEMRVPLLDGFKFVTEAAAAEEHYKLKSVIFRPISLPPPSKERNDSKDYRVLEAYKQLCTPPPGSKEEWPATCGGPQSPGPFQRSFLHYMRSIRSAADSGERRVLSQVRWPSLLEYGGSASCTPPARRTAAGRGRARGGRGGGAPDSGTTLR